MKEKNLHIASWILIGLLLLPIFQQVTGLFHVRKLRGAVTTADYPEWSVRKWFEEDLQGQTEEALNDRFGFRPFFVRVNNQVAFSLYNKALASGVVIGKDNYMYERNYLKAKLGEDYLGDSVIQNRAEKLREIQDYFTGQGTHLFVAFAAGKGSFYPEFFPDQYRETAGQTNLDKYKSEFEKLGINYIDYNNWFLEMKDTSEYNLYPRTGVHWSYYGMVLVIDSLRSYLAEATGEKMPVFEWGNVKLSRNYRSSDDDIEKGMNILFRVNYDRMAYPEVAFYDEDVDKLKGIVIADSFYWGLHNIGFSSRIFKEGEFWYYFNRIYANHLDDVIQIKEINALQRLRNADVIMLMATEATLPDFPFGFIERIYNEIQTLEPGEPAPLRP